MIISLVLMLVLGVQSCGVAAGGSIGGALSDSAADQKAAEELEGAGGIGLFAALLWLVAAAFVLSKPRVSMWVFGVAGLLCLLGGATSEFTDLWGWAVASFAFAAMSWRGIKEKVDKDAEERSRYLADVQAAAAAGRQAPPAGEPPTTPS